MEYNKLSAPLKIALVLDDYYPSSSGVSRSIQSQIDELSAMGHQVTLIAPEKNFTPPKNAEHITLKSVQPPGALKPFSRVVLTSQSLSQKIINLTLFTAKQTLELSFYPPESLECSRFRTFIHFIPTWRVQCHIIPNQRC